MFYGNIDANCITIHVTSDWIEIAKVNDPTFDKDVECERKLALSQMGFKYLRQKKKLLKWR